ncbi:hypothetical protein H6G20_19195 [Desertifilum sp. FACHB-1129]|uniref:Uncharacterized protein n=2 Tax=Desertifilum tharense IPPAS B-1220 TaxID=1781255 RepID=A0A1E5QL93_9CYAN|nr:MULTISPECIES: hypothetical protein [Desertifilum]MCD8489700.1 hypothetical protein [Desertifilum sp.]MDA0209934.1 hypothetical protein [Cyanobacteria bacterium FC1]NES94785.1 hypothetical protein [Desertifilum sp. SIO1I2]MBD2313798.1 hypothetical protein [Desertifilum sp. FACHB-1129]MBD2324491.1 hypothetical protein [Desertifilum sp. FACHB-866]
MSSSTYPSARFSDDAAIWESLQTAIAASSGFQRWQNERSSDRRLADLNQEQLVSRYLRETLETLAY